MSKEIVIWPFLDAKGKRTTIGDDAPNESESNLVIYRKHGLIGVAPNVSDAALVGKRKVAGKKKV